MTMPAVVDVEVDPNTGEIVEELAPTDDADDSPF